MVLTSLTACDEMFDYSPYAIIFFSFCTGLMKKFCFVD